MQKCQKPLFKIHEEYASQADTNPSKPKAFQYYNPGDSCFSIFLHHVAFKNSSAAVFCAVTDGPLDMGIRYRWSLNFRKKTLFRVMPTRYKMSLK